MYLFGGSPLNNEVWYLKNVTKVDRIEPLTRSLYSNYTYNLQWVQLDNAPWSPRVGMGAVSQYYFNTKLKETYEDAKERIVAVGGYGGWVESTSTTSSTSSTSNGTYDGFYCRSDIWTFNGTTWTQLNTTSALGSRAWFGMVTQTAADRRYDIRSSTIPPKMYIFGGGYIGTVYGSKKRVTKMLGKADAYYSTDGITWTKINYEEGGGTTGYTYYSSQEWAKTVVDTDTNYLGLWGHTIVSFNFTTLTSVSLIHYLYIIYPYFFIGER